MSGRILSPAARAAPKAAAATVRRFPLPDAAAAPSTAEPAAPGKSGPQPTLGMIRLYKPRFHFSPAVPYSAVPYSAQVDHLPVGLEQVRVSAKLVTTQSKRNLPLADCRLERGAEVPGDSAPVFQPSKYDLDGLDRSYIHLDGGLYLGANTGRDCVSYELDIQLWKGVKIILLRIRRLKRTLKFLRRAARLIDNLPIKV